jgi:hypothetical protein
MRITVTQEIIDRAMRRDANVDLIAQAIRDVFPDAKMIMTSIDLIKWTGADGRRRVYETPAIARDAMFAFDQAEPVEPFTFDLEERQ